MSGTIDDCPPSPRLRRMSEALVGTTLDGRYRIVRELGRGGMGAVYEAHHTGIDRRLAVKVLHAEVAGEPAVLERFRREARITGALGHPNIIQVTDTGNTPGGAPYLVMELLEGRSLSSVLRRSVPLGLRQALDIIVPVLRALSAVHANGIVHRDLKPENIFLAEGIGADGAGETVVKVLDFGISKPVDTKLEGSTLTATGTVVGTPYYMSPEQVRGKDVDHRTDLYACGVILYEMLMGRAPFDADNFGDLFVAILTEAPAPVRALRPELPEALEEVVHRAMARDKEERFASADALLRALAPLADLAPAAEKDATATQEHVIEDAEERESVAPWHVAPGWKPLEEATTSAHELARPRRWGLAVGLAALVAAAITVAVLLGVGAGSDVGGSASGSNVVRDASPSPATVVEGSPAPVVSANVEPDSEPSGLEVGVQVALDGGPAEVDAGSPLEPAVREALEPVPAEGRGPRSPREEAPVDVRPAPPAPEVPYRPRPGKTPGRRIVTDIDDRRPPSPVKTPGRVEPRRVVTDIDERLPRGRR